MKLPRLEDLVFIRITGMDDMAEDYLNYQTITYEELVGKGRKKQQLYDIDPDKVTEYAAEDADITLRLHNVLHPNFCQTFRPQGRVHLEEEHEPSFLSP